MAQLHCLVAVQDNVFVFVFVFVSVLYLYCAGELVGTMEEESECEEVEEVAGSLRLLLLLGQALDRDEDEDHCGEDDHQVEDHHRGEDHHVDEDHGDVDNCDVFILGKGT